MSTQSASAERSRKLRNIGTNFGIGFAALFFGVLFFEHDIATKAFEGASYGKTLFNLVLDAFVLVLGIMMVIRASIMSIVDQIKHNEE